MGVCVILAFARVPRKGVFAPFFDGKLLNLFLDNEGKFRV